MTKQYEYNKKWREEHPDARNAAKLRNYASSRDNAFNKGQPYTQHEDEQILNSDLTDRQLGEKIGRSAQSIQVRRNRLLYGREE